MAQSLQAFTSLSDQALPALAPALRRVAQVRGHDGYGCQPHRYDYPRWLAVRTVAGSGSFALRRGGQVTVAADQLLLVRQCDLLGFLTQQAPWDVWWYEFLLEPLPVPEQVVLSIPGARSEVTTGMACQRWLAMRSNQARTLAATRFAGLLAEWSLYCAHQERFDEGRADRLLAAMHAHPDGSLRLDDLAAIAGVGQRRLRTLLLAATGLSPARCYARIRAAHGAELVQLHGASVREAAQHCGFGDRQTFTRACRRLLGVTPSDLRTRVQDPHTERSP